MAEYPHNLKQEGNRTDTGLSITGGYVYRGSRLKELVGVYVYADYLTGRVWGLIEKNGRTVANAELIDVTGKMPTTVSSFGEDRSGDLYLLAFDGRIHRLVPRP